MQTVFVFVRIFAIILSIIGTSFLLPIGTALAFGEYEAILPFLIPMVVAWIFGSAFYFGGKKVPVKFGTRAIFVFVSFAWVVFMAQFRFLPAVGLAIFRARFLNP